MIKVMTIVGTRPEIIKLSEVIKELDKFTNHILVHSGQNYDYELNEVFFKDLGLRKPDFFLEAAGKNAAETIGNVIVKSDALLEQEKPDAVLLYGDTNSCLAVISAKKRKIPIFHMEAGNRCFDQRVPEEINRKIVDHLSDINMPLSEHARRYLIAEGLPPEKVIKSGSPMREVLNRQMEAIDASDVLERENLKARDYFIVSIHREENVDSEENFSDLMESLNAISEHFDKTVIISTHPRTRKKLEEINFVSNNTSLIFSKPFGFHDYIKLQKNAFCVISDSGTITEEASILNLPAITIRQAHERPEGMDEGTLIMTGLKKERIMESIKVVTEQFDHNKRSIHSVEDYDTDNVSKKVLRIILSYTDYINRTVWKKGNEKIMILGSTGMLGHQVYFHLKDDANFEIIDVSYRNKLKPESIILDFNFKQDLEHLIKKRNPDYVINCVGVLIKGANDNPSNAIYLNSFLPHFLSSICDTINATLIHVSTDCVFSGEKGGYLEKDEKDGKDIYAKTKALGEVENPNHLTLRTSIIGPELKENGEGLFHWFMQQEEETNGYTKAVWSGVTTTELSKVIRTAINHQLKGLYHVTNGEPINKFKLLQLFKEYTGKSIIINEVEGKEVDKSFLDTRKELERTIPSYPQMVEEMVGFMKVHPELYKNYTLN